MSFVWVRWLDVHSISAQSPWFCQFSMHTAHHTPPPTSIPQKITNFINKIRSINNKSTAAICHTLTIVAPDWIASKSGWMLVSSNTNTVDWSLSASRSILVVLYSGFKWAGKWWNVIHLLMGRFCIGSMDTPRDILWYHNVSTTRPFLLLSHASDVGFIGTKPKRTRMQKDEVALCSAARWRSVNWWLKWLWIVD